MNKAQKISLLLLRLGMGWYFFYSGITKVLNPQWSAAGYLENAQSFQFLFTWLASPANTVWVNLVNEWGLTLIGALLLLGIWVRWASVAGIVFMLLYWLPVLSFPYAGEHAYIIDEHILYVFVFLTLIHFSAGRYWGFDGRKL